MEKVSSTNIFTLLFTAQKFASRNEKQKSHVTSSVKFEVGYDLILARMREMDKKFLLEHKLKLGYWSTLELIMMSLPLAPTPTSFNCNLK